MGFPIKRRIVCDDGAGRAPCGLDLLSAVIDARPELAGRGAARNGRPQDYRGAAIASSSSSSASAEGGDASDDDGRRDGDAPSPAAAAAPSPDPSSLPPAASATERVVGAGAAGSGRIEEFAVQLRTELMLRELQRRGGEGVLGRDRARVLLRFLREMTPLTDSDVASRYIAEKLRRRALERRRRAHQRGIATRLLAFSERDASRVIVEESKCGNGNE